MIKIHNIYTKSKKKNYKLLGYTPNMGTLQYEHNNSL